MTLSNVIMPKDWDLMQFGDLLAEPVRNGIYKKKEFHGRGTKIINMGELFANDFITNQEMKRVELGSQELSKYELRNGDLLFARRSLVLEGAGKCSIVGDTLEATTFESSIIRARLNNNLADPKFYFYLFKSSVGRGIMASIATRTAVSGIRGSDLVLLEVPKPPITIQQQIATTLSTYDELIENNTRRIQILEEMAQTIYREWFIKFRFLGHEQIQVVDSGTELGEVPVGWEEMTLGDVLDTLESGSRPKGGIDPSERGVPSIGAENILGLGKYNYSKEKFVSQEFFKSMKRGHVQDQDVLLYKDGAKLGRKSLFRDGFPHEICCINEHVFILRSNESCTQSYLYFWLDQPNITQSIRNLNTNAAQPGISQAKVKSLPILIPDSKTMNSFEGIVDPLLSLILNLAKKNFYLRNLRDLLLPKIISGEITVNSMEIEPNATI